MMTELKSFKLTTLSNSQNFEESAYLVSNPDVQQAIDSGAIGSAKEHFEAFGLAEGRLQRQELPWEWKHRKLGRVRTLLRRDLPHRETLSYIDCLTDQLREQFRIVSTDNVSEHDYDPQALALIQRHANGLVLDCGAGQRNTYYDNVVNYEIVAYDSTDVLGVAEQLPFLDNSFDAVVCLNVLEHVKDPFQVARELMRVLKPGGELFCVAPFLQPRHGYPHHYYNMTREGLLNIFEGMESPSVSIYGAMQPIWALNWFLHNYANGLPEHERASFEAMTVAQLMAPATALELDGIATSLSEAARTELASAHALHARKPKA